MAKELKALIREEIARRFKDVDGGVVIRYRGLDSEKTYDLRKKLQAKGVKLNVVKNALASRAFSDIGYKPEHFSKLLDGPVGIVYAKDPKVGAAGAAKALLEWVRESKNKDLQVTGGFLSGTVLDEKGVKALSEMPSREQMLAILAGTFQAPISSLATVLKETVAKLAYAVDAVKKKKEEAAGASPAAAPAGN